MLEGEPGTLEPREELTLPGEVSGCWGEREGGRVGMCVGARAGRREGVGQGRASLGLWGPGVRHRGQPPGGILDSRPDPPRGAWPPPRAPGTPLPRRGCSPAHLLQPFHAAGSWPAGSLAEPCARGETTGRQALSGSWALRARGRESRKGAPPGCGVLIPR